MSKTYLQIVNDAIQESGADLDQFEADGSDWTAMGRDSLMYKFKVWVNRAWQTIQQNAYDWEWMSEQAVVNINPGIMFYSPDAIDWTYDTVNPLVIYDVDDSEAVVGNEATKVVDLTGEFTNTENFGYINLDSSGSNPISFGMKSGGEYFNSTISGDNNSLALIATDVHSYYGALPAYPTISGYPQTLETLPEGEEIVALHIATSTDSDPTTVTFHGEYPVTGTARLSTGGPATDVQIVDFEDTDLADFLDDYKTYIASADPDHDMMVVCVEAADGTLSGGFVKNAQVRGYNVGLKFSQMDVTVEDAGFQAGSIDEYGGFTAAVGSTLVEVDVNSSGNNVAGYTFDVDATIASFIRGPNQGGDPVGAFDSMIFTIDTDLDSSTISGSDLFQLTAILSTLGQDYSANINTTEGGTAGMTIVFAYSGGAEATSSLEVTQTASSVHKCYIHSWKSFDWSEELDDDDFVEEVAELDQQSYRYVTHEDPAPGSEIKLKFVPWEQYRVQYESATYTPGQPYIITKDSVGRWRLYPHPDRPGTVLFDYVRNPQQLSAWDDVIKGIPDDYADIIMWRAIIYFGEYDEQPSVVARATRNYKDMLSRLEYRYRDKFHFAPKRLY